MKVATQILKHGFNIPAAIRSLVARELSVMQSRMMAIQAEAEDAQMSIPAYLRTNKAEKVVAQLASLKN